MSEKIEVSVGKLEVQVERLEQDMIEMKGDVKAIRATLDETKGSCLLSAGSLPQSEAS